MQAIQQKPKTQTVRKIISTLKEYKDFLTKYFDTKRLKPQELNSWIKSLNHDNTTYLRKTRKVVLPLSLNDLNFLIRGGEIVFEQANKEYHYVISDLGYFLIANITLAHYLEN